MSFAFPKPVPESRTISDSDSDSDFDFGIYEYYTELMSQTGPDYDELIIRLSLFAFNRLSPGDQREQLEEIRHNVNAESDDFTELFKKLNYSHQQELLSIFLQKFKRERLISSFQQIFDEFFVGFSSIWFQGQWASGQDMLIEQLYKGVGGTVVTEQRLQDDETEEDFKLRRFTELCNKIVDFRVQEKFLNNAEEKLNKWGSGISRRLILEPQDCDSAAELLSRLTTLGFGLLSAKYQQPKIEELSNLVEGQGGVTIKLIKWMIRQIYSLLLSSDDDEEDFRMTRFIELFNQVPVRKRIDLFKELREILGKEKPYSEAVRFFRGLGSQDQMEVIEKLSDEIKEYLREGRDRAELIIEKFSGESEEDFRLRRFTKLCNKSFSTRSYLPHWLKAGRQGTSEESSSYASFLLNASITWFKARCANYRRNPIPVVLLGQVDPFHDHIIVKVPEESEEDFRLRRFTESFKQLEFTHQVQLVDYIQDTLFSDLGYRKPRVVPYALSVPPEGRGEFDPEWIKMKSPIDQFTTSSPGVTATSSSRGATTQAGGGRGRGHGTSQPSASRCIIN